MPRPPSATRWATDRAESASRHAEPEPQPVPEPARIERRPAPYDTTTLSEYTSAAAYPAAYARRPTETEVVAPVVTPSEPVAETAVVAPVVAAAPLAPQPIFVQAPEAPSPRGNRAAAGAIGLLAALVLRACSTSPRGSGSARSRATSRPTTSARPRSARSAPGRCG